MQTYILPPAWSWQACGRWYVLCWTRRSSSSRPGCRSSRRKRSTGCRRCPWRPSHPAWCWWDLEEAQGCAVNIESGVIFSIGRELACHKRQKRKSSYLKLISKNCCATLEKLPLHTVEELRQIWKEMPQSVSMYGQTSPAYLASKEPLFEWRGSGEPTVNAIQSTSQLCGPLLIGVYSQRGKKSV